MHCNCFFCMRIYWNTYIYLMFFLFSKCPAGGGGKFRLFVALSKLAQKSKIVPRALWLFFWMRIYWNKYIYLMFLLFKKCPAGENFGGPYIRRVFVSQRWHPNPRDTSSVTFFTAEILVTPRVSPNFEFQLRFHFGDTYDFGSKGAAFFSGVKCDFLAPPRWLEF